MAYTVIKTVKGRQYLYLQESYRQGSSVRTKSIYLGAIDPATGEVGELAPKSAAFLEKYPQQIRDRILIAGDPRKHRPEEEQAQRQHLARERAKKAARAREKGEGVLDIRLDCSKHKISAYALEQDYRAYKNRLGRVGVPFPPVIMKYGFRLRLYQREGKGQAAAFVVSIPRNAQVNREFIRGAYRRGLALASLAALQEHKPEDYAKLSLHFSDSFFETQKLLNRFIMATNENDALVRAVALRFFGILHPIAGGKLKPVKLGIVEYGKRKSWIEEAAALMADIQRRGWHNLYSEAIAEEGKAQNAQNFIIQDKKQWGKRQKKALKRAEIRVLLNREKQEKLKILKRIF